VSLTVVIPPCNGNGVIPVAERKGIIRHLGMGYCNTGDRYHNP
jgi:hypothetical protein